MHRLLAVAVSTEWAQVGAGVVRPDAVDMMDMQQVPMVGQIYTALIAIESAALPYFGGDRLPVLRIVGITHSLR
ncbi:hypothetical protein D9M73_252120 [compost metagenome]